MPEIGEIKGARSNRYIRHACIDCGKESWVQLVKGEPKTKRCQPCSNRKRGLERRGSNSEHWKGGQRFNGSYNKLYYPDHPRADSQGYVSEHLLVWEEVNRQSLPEGWVVHHINGDKRDNRPRNLIGMPKKSHSPALATKEVQKRLREVEIENRQLRRALEDNQLIWLGGN